MGEDPMITVCGVMLDLGKDPGIGRPAQKLWNRVAWEAGATVRTRWEAAHESRPAVMLTKKTRGEGTHDKAHYPESWRVTIEEAIHDAEISCGTLGDERQGSLFDGDR